MKGCKTSSPHGRRILAPVEACSFHCTLEKHESRQAGFHLKSGERRNRSVRWPQRGPNCGQRQPEPWRCLLSGRESGLTEQVPALGVEPATQTSFISGALLGLLRCQSNTQSQTGSEDNKMGSGWSMSQSSVSEWGVAFLGTSHRSSIRSQGGLCLPPNSWGLNTQTWETEAEFSLCPNSMRTEPA